VLSLGTAFDTAFYQRQGIPRDLRIEAGSSTATPVSADAAIVQATTNFVKRENPKLRPKVQVERVRSDYARASVSARGTDSAWAYLHREQGTWKVLSLGTGFDPAFYQRQGIPRELQIGAPAEGTKITLARNPGNQPIGVEPQGGHFAQVIGPQAKTPNQYTFSTYGKNQDESILAIYSTNASLIPLEKPLARVRLSGLPAGETEKRVRVEMKLNPDRSLTISAFDLKRGGRPLTITKLDGREMLTTKLTAPTRTPLQPGLLRIATGPSNEIAPKDGIKQFIGVRRAGGIFQPVLSPGDSAATTAEKPGKTYFCTSFPGQLTVDMRLFAGDSPYIERTKPFVRYLISGIKPNDRPRNSIKLELRVGSNGRIVPTATEMATDTTLKVEKYSLAALERLQAQGQLGQSQPFTEDGFAGRIPATPVR
jgi:hypothetical protein